IESIRTFDVLTQLSVEPLEELRILPVDVSFAPRTTSDAALGERRSLLSYLPREAVIVDVAAGTAESDWEKTWTEVLRLHAAEEAAGRSPEPPEHLFAPPAEVASEVSRYPRLYIGQEGAPADAPELHFRIRPPEVIERNMPLLGEILREGGRKGERTLILCDNEGQLERLQELLSDLGVDTGVTLATGSLNGGFVLAEAVPIFRVLTDHEIFRR